MRAFCDARECLDESVLNMVRRVEPSWEACILVNVCRNFSRVALDGQVAAINKPSVLHAAERYHRGVHCAASDSLLNLGL